MLIPQLLDAYLFVGLLLFVLGFLLSRQAPQSTAPCCVAVVTGILGSVAFVVALRLWGEIHLAAKTAAPAPASAYGTQASTRIGAR